METENSGNLKSWVITVEEHGDDLILPLPQDLLDTVGWVTDDVLTWIENEDGTWTLTKKITPLDQPLANEGS
jgi:hypothetical protein